MSEASTPFRVVGRGYPLGSLFLLVTACGSILALILPLVRGWKEFGIGRGDLFATMILGGMAMGALGMFLGLFHRPRWIGSAWGVLIGSLLGMACGPSLLIPPERFPAVFFTSLGGSFLLILLAGMLRHVNGPAASAAPTAPTGFAPAVSTPAGKPKKPHPLDPDPSDNSPSSHSH